MEGHLWKIIQKHLDDYGVREAEFARRIGTSPQTVNSWKKRGVRSLPEKRLLIGISDVTRQPYDLVLDAALRDTRYLPREDVRNDDRSAPTRQAPGSGADVQVQHHTSSASDSANVTQLPSAAALDPTLPDDIAARDETGKGRTQQARERQDEEGEEL